MPSLQIAGEIVTHPTSDWVPWCTGLVSKVTLWALTSLAVQDVVILGSGAFGLEAMEAADRAGAASITLVMRERNRRASAGLELSGKKRTAAPGC